MMECPSCGQSAKNVAFWVDAEAHSIVVDGQYIKFCPKEFIVFSLLYSRAPRKVTTYQLSSVLWDDHEPEFAENNIKVYLNMLRKKLAGTRLVIECIWGEGYRFVTLAGVPE
jgi:DNA-binding response OmpR family regulator